MPKDSSSHPYNLRHLLPGPQSPHSNDSNPSRRVLPRPRAAVACETCRKRKVRCDGARPKCNTCTRGATECIYKTSMVPTIQVQELKRRYDSLEQEANVHQRLLQLMQSRSQEEATMIFHKIRQGVEAHAVLRLVETGDLFGELSLVPQTAYRYEFPFLQEMPAFVKSGDNLYLQSPIFEWSIKPSRSPSIPGTGTSPATISQIEPPAPYSKPYHAAEVIDTLLESTEPSKWTNVSTDNVLMRKLFRAYLLHDYEWFPFFQKDYFFEDMAAGKDTFCSELLVNSVLAMACYCYRDMQTFEFWNPNSLSYQFLAEAKRLWEIEEVSGRKRLTTVHAAPLINIVYSFMGADKLGWQYTLRAIPMAVELQIFDAPTKKRDQRLQRGRDFTAWALFSWQSHCACHYLLRPMLEKPPASSLPDPALFSQWYGDIWIKYPLNSTIFSTNLGHFFKARAEYLVILSDISLLSFGEYNSPLKPNNTKLYALYLRLEYWLKSLPEYLSPSRISLPNHIKLHMHYCFVVMRMFKPAMEPRRANSTSAMFGDGVTMKRAQEIFIRANISFETLFRIYYLRHGFEGLDGFLIAYLVFWSFETMDKLNANADDSRLDSIRSTLLLCAKGLYEQGRIYFLARTMFQLMYRRMRPEDVELFGRFVTTVENDDQENKRTEYIQSQWPIRFTTIGGGSKIETVHELMEGSHADSTGELSE